MKLYTHYTLLGLLLLVGGGALVLDLQSRETAAPATYVGQETCMSSGCHADYKNKRYQGAEKFRETMHQKIHLRPTPENVIIDRWFANDTVLKYIDSQLGGDTLSIAFSKGETERDYFLQMFISGKSNAETPKMRVEYTYGGNGWLQRFLVKINGSYYVPPFQYIMPEYRSRSDTGIVNLPRLTEWLSYDPNESKLSFLDWNSNAFRKGSWDKKCIACHVNGFDVEQSIVGEDSTWYGKWYGTETGDSALIDQNILIGCESCHGPGSEHIANPTDENIIAPGNKNQFPDTKEGTDLKLALCNQCHNRHNSNMGTHGYPYDEANRQPFIPGQLLDNFVKEAPQTWSDGVTSYAHHQTGQDYRRSKAYKERIFPNGCWSCHTVHHNEEGLPYQLDRNWYSLEPLEGCQALNCHEGFEETETRVNGIYNKHSQHLQKHSQCVNCHFTKTASISLTERQEFTDHSFRVIRPTVTKEFADLSYGFSGTPNTCAASCHRNGRGERNNKPGDMLAPDYGIHDVSFLIFREKTDRDLADSLWEGYKRLYPQYVTAVRVAGEAASITSITSVVPNPVSDAATVSFRLAATGSISLSVYDNQGRQIRVLAEGRHEEGVYTQQWDALDEFGNAVPNGAYFVRLSAEGRISSRKFIIAR